MDLLRRRLAFCRALGSIFALFTFALAAGAGAQGAAPDSASPEQQKQAQARYDQGVQHYKANRFAEAADAFRDSVEIVASPNARLMYARALRESGKLEEAYEELALTQQQASELAVRLPKYAGAAESAEAEMAALLRKTAALRVELRGADPADVELTVGDRQVPRSRWRAIAVKPGSYEVAARGPSGARASRSVDAEQGQVTSVELDLAVPSEAQSSADTELGMASMPATDSPERDRDGTPALHPLRPWAFVAGGIGLVGLATFAVAGSMSRGTFATLEDECPNKACPQEFQRDIDRGKTEQLIANVGLVVGAVGVTTGLVLFVIDLGADEAKTAPKAVRVAVGPTSLGVTGSF